MSFWWLYYFFFFGLSQLKQKLFSTLLKKYSILNILFSKKKNTFNITTIYVPIFLSQKVISRLICTFRHLLPCPSPFSPTKSFSSFFAVVVSPGLVPEPPGQISQARKAITESARPLGDTVVQRHDEKHTRLQRVPGLSTVSPSKLNQSISAGENQFMVFPHSRRFPSLWGWRWIEILRTKL